MAQQTINKGTTANDGTGESPFTAFGKVNSNFTELYAAVAASLDRGANAIGSYALAYVGAGTSKTLNQTIAGASLVFAGVDAPSSGVTADLTTPLGTWRCMGSNGAVSTSVCLWQRIA